MLSFTVNLLLVFSLRKNKFNAFILSLYFKDSLIISFISEYPQLLIPLKLFSLSNTRSFKP